MIDRASAEISKCIMRLKRKETKKPPEIPPKPTGASIVGSGSNGGGGGGQIQHNSTTIGSNSTSTTNKSTTTQPPITSNVSSSTMSTPTTTTVTMTSTIGPPIVDSLLHSNKHGGVAVLPLPHLTSLSSHSSPVTPRKFPSLRKTQKSKKVIVSSSQLWNDEDFLKCFFSRYFSGNEKLVLPAVCRRWRDVSYGMENEFWGDLIPVLKCKELRGGRADLNAGVRRRFYGGLVKRGFSSLKLHSATDEDAEDVIIHYSQGSTLVETLKICSSSLTDKGLFNLLDHLSALQQLELSSCNEITEEGFNNALPKKLTRLVIYDCIHIADTSVSYVARNLSTLTAFELQAYHVTDCALAAFNPKFNSNLSTLKLNSCWELTNQTVLHIVSGLPQLKSLSLSGCSKITDEGIEVLAENLHHLKTLDLSWCPRITDASLECIACDLNCLEGLVLDRCSIITDLGIGYLATMSSLKVLSMRWCSIRDASIHHMISMKKLQYLSLAGCTNIAPSTLCSLSSLRNLKELELTNCGVTPQVLHFLKNTLNCVIIE